MKIINFITIFTLFLLLGGYVFAASKTYESLNKYDNTVVFDINLFNISVENNVWNYMDDNGNNVINYSYPSGFNSRIELKNTPYVLERRFDRQGKLITSVLTILGMQIGEMLIVGKDGKLNSFYNDELYYKINFDDIVDIMKKNFNINIENANTLCFIARDNYSNNVGNRSVYKLTIRSSDNKTIDYLIDGNTGELINREMSINGCLY